MKNYKELPNEFVQRIKTLVASAAEDKNVKSLMVSLSKEGQIEVMARLILAAID